MRRTLTNAEFAQQLRDYAHTAYRFELQPFYTVDPPTDYQRWMRWRGRFNTEAGETLHYLTVDQATEAGLLNGVALRDWWFFDNDRLMVLTHNPEGRRIHTELITDEHELNRARALWDLAVHTTRGENT